MFIRRPEPSTIDLQKRLQEVAKQLRTHSTKAEEHLWKYLRSKRLNGIKFRRQHPLFTYIIDFYSHEYKLIIEIDGSSHDHKFTRDAIRDGFFERNGYTILRFTNEQVLFNMKYVLSIIKSKTPFS